MFGIVRWITWFFLRCLVWLRYRLVLRGVRSAAKGKGPFLILPNHPAFSDPVCVITAMWPRFKMRPMLLETNFENPLLAPFAFLLRGIRIPDTDKASAEARQRAEASIADAIGAMKGGDNVILWPSGHLQRRPFELIGGARAVSDILTAVPNATVVLVRTRGLWGSMFSWAYATKPDLTAGMLKATWVLLSNLLVLGPRRKVTITLAAFGPEQRPAPTREAINRWLEEWYNADSPETPTFVPYHVLFGPKQVTFPPPVDGRPAIDLSKIPAATKAEVTRLLEEKIRRPMEEAENVPSTSFQDLGMDSLERMEVGLAIEQHFGFHSDDVPQTIGEMWALAEGQLSTAPPKPPPAEWFARMGDHGPAAILGDTVPVAFVERAFASALDIAEADDLAGAVTYERMLIGATVMSRRFREIPAANIGLLLPATVTADVAFCALGLAGKLPVLLNWTTGPANLAHAARLMKLTHVVTSKTFVDRLAIVVEGTKFLFLEDVRAGIGKFELLRTMVAIRYFPGRTKARLLASLDADPQKPAVVLFTSGSEKSPKAVPLSHANIIAVQRGVLQSFRFTRTESAMGFLPMFHSFGLTITGLLPLLAGVRVVRHPDPTDAAAIVRKMVGYRTTLVAGTPTFLGHIFDRAKPGEFEYLRIIVSGAEKAPESLFQKAALTAPSADVLEGYGITECSPVVSVTLPGKPHRGTVGPPLPGVLVSVRDLETNAPLPLGARGMLHVAGPTVFAGYLGSDVPPPFLEAEGQRWYVTGDLGAIDELGEVVFHGRLKRFLKAGGEMISLPALEEPFAKRFPATDAGPRVAVEGIETPSGRRIVLFTINEITLKDANAILRQEGHLGVMRIDEVVKLDVIPILGTGKTDYKVLRARIAPASSP